MHFNRRKSKFIFTAVLERVDVRLGGRDGRGGRVAIDAAVLFAAAIRSRVRRRSFLRLFSEIFGNFCAWSRNLDVLFCQPHPLLVQTKKTIKHAIAMKYIRRRYS